MKRGGFGLGLGLGITNRAGFNPAMLFQAGQMGVWFDPSDLSSMWQDSAGTTPAIETVEAVSGACMALPREVFARLGGFDESYFLHVEDLDLCRRVRDAGLRVAIAHEIRVVHAGGSSSRHRPLFVARHKHRGMWRYFDKFDPAARSGWLRALVWSGIWLHFVVVAPLQALRAAWRRGRSAGRGRFTHG